MSFLQTHNDASSPQVRGIRDQLMAGRASVPIFAEGIGKSDRTVWSYIAQGMPVEYIGRTPVVVVTPAIAWLRNRKTRGVQGPRPRGRPRKAT
jgi:hypothetical protein